MEVDYRDTLRLPKNVLPSNGKLPTTEESLLPHLQKTPTYLLPNGTFSLHDGPPYANGDIHIGHAMNKIHKDIAARGKAMLGYQTSLKLGWDCHGLPIEWEVERMCLKDGVSLEAISTIDFREMCRAHANKWVTKQSKSFDRLGIRRTGDYTTMSYKNEAKIAETFTRFVENNHVYSANQPIMWSTVEQTSLAEAEVEYADVKTTSIYVKFPVKRGIEETNLSMVVYTTTPWTLPANAGLAVSQSNQFLNSTVSQSNQLDQSLNKVVLHDPLSVHKTDTHSVWTTTSEGTHHIPMAKYAIYEVTRVDDEAENWVKQGDKFILSLDTARNVMNLANVDEFSMVRVLDDGEILGIVCEHPLAAVDDRFSKDVEVVNAGFVAAHEGTGIVHMAPKHGMDDHYVCLNEGLFENAAIEPTGRMRDDIPVYGGMEVVKSNGKFGGASAAVVADLGKKGALVATAQITHSYPHSWRSKTPVLFLSMPQWFISMDDGPRQWALDAIDRDITFSAAKDKERLVGMIKTRPDWLVSRQRKWGVPLPLFYKEEHGRVTDILVDKVVNERIVSFFEIVGSDAWYQEGAYHTILDNRANEGWIMCQDVLDVWFDSGCTHLFDEEHLGQYDMVVEGTDQHRGWFQTSLIIGAYLNRKAPFKYIKTTGFTVDKRGLKMSKSGPNAVSPNKVIEQYGTDVLRMWVASTDVSKDHRVGNEMLSGAYADYKKYRNTVKFLLGNMANNPGSPIFVYSWEETGSMEAMVLSQAERLNTSIKAMYEMYDFKGVVSAVMKFCQDTLSSLYFTGLKDHLYCGEPDRHVYDTLYTLYAYLKSWMAPILPFTAQEMRSKVFNTDTVENPVHGNIHMTRFPADMDPHHPDDQDLDTLMRVKQEVQAKIVEAGFTNPMDVDISITARPQLASLLCRADSGDLVGVSSLHVESKDMGTIGAMSITVEEAYGHKCPRCWKKVSVAENELCYRCEPIVERMNENGT